jgi:prevent-host-death family protein
MYGGGFAAAIHTYDSRLMEKVQTYLLKKVVEGQMLKTISTSDLRIQIKRVLNEVGYGQAQYVVEKFGEPTAAIISLDDFRLLQSAKQEQAAASLRQTIAGVRARNRQLDADELEALIKEARAEFHRLSTSPADGG